MPKRDSSKQTATKIAIITSITSIVVTVITGIFSLKATQVQNNTESSQVAITTPEELKGYQLFFDGTPVNYEPNWTCHEAVKNLSWNIKQHPDKKVEGWFDDKKIEFANTGYELFSDCRRVGYEPNWTSQQALENLLWNIDEYPNNEIEGWFNGEQLNP